LETLNTDRRGGPFDDSFGAPYVVIFDETNNTQATKQQNKEFINVGYYNKGVAEQAFCYVDVM
jgi:hypothetical protein